MTQWRSRLAPFLLMSSAAVTLMCQAEAESLPQTPEAAARLEASYALPLTPFFDAKPDPKLKPGTLIRAEAFDGYDVPSGSHATRILYTSRSSADQPTVASGVIITPAGTPPAGGWPMVVWAHGTTGVARVCAPTLSKPAGYNVVPFLKEGFAVLAPDYSGLGAGTEHEYLSKIANANDTVNAVAAARALKLKTTANWVVVGHSQGGLTAWGVAEKMAQLKDPTYLGSVSIAGAVDMENLVEHLDATPGEMFYVVYVAYGIKAQYPYFDINSMLTPVAAEAFDSMTRKTCWAYGNTMFVKAKPHTLLRPNWKENSTVKAYLKGDQTGIKPIAGPMFVIAGRQDDAVPPANVAPRVEALCRLPGAVVEYKVYEGDHDTELNTSLADQLSWIRDRFAGKQAPSSCHSS